MVGQSATMSNVGTCQLCDEPGIVSINGAWYCVPHCDDGFRAVVRGLAIERGADVDKTEALGVEMLTQLLDEYEQDDS